MPSARTRMSRCGARGAVITTWTRRRCSSGRALSSTLSGNGGTDPARASHCLLTVSRVAKTCALWFCLLPLSSPCVGSLPFCVDPSTKMPSGLTIELPPCEPLDHDATGASQARRTRRGLERSHSLPVPSGWRCEVQVRTRCMHETAERGTAAHAGYKASSLAFG